MTIRTLDYGTLNIINSDKIDKRFDTLIDVIEGCDIDEWYEVYQLADDKNSIVAVQGQEE